MCMCVLYMQYVMYIIFIDHYVHTRDTLETAFGNCHSQVYFTNAMLNEFKMVLNQCFHRNYLAQIHVHLNDFDCQFLDCCECLLFCWCYSYLNDINFEIHENIRMAITDDRRIFILFLNFTFYLSLIRSLSLYLSISLSIVFSFLVHTLFHPTNFKSS